MGEGVMTEEDECEAVGRRRWYSFDWKALEP